MRTKQFAIWNKWKPNPCLEELKGQIDHETKFAGQTDRQGLGYERDRYRKIFTPAQWLTRVAEKLSKWLQHWIWRKSTSGRLDKIWRRQTIWYVMESDRNKKIQNSLHGYWMHPQIHWLHQRWSNYGNVLQTISTHCVKAKDHYSTFYPIANVPSSKEDTLGDMALSWLLLKSTLWNILRNTTSLLW